MRSASSTISARMRRNFPSFGPRTPMATAMVRSAALPILTLASLFGVAGGTWDAAWHVTLLRETFWTPPHLLLYGGTGLALLGAGAGILGA